VREYAEAGELDSLLAADQLLQAMDEGEVFNGYDEGRISFRWVSGLHRCHSVC
jgi:hypothetical protein